MGAHACEDGVDHCTHALILPKVKQVVEVPALGVSGQFGVDLQFKDGDELLDVAHGDLRHCRALRRRMCEGNWLGRESCRRAGLCGNAPARTPSRTSWCL